MLLRRVIEHVKTQNWTAVALDFLIVVVGVFIGIQVANWNAARIEAQREALILERLAEDFRQIEISAAGIHETYVDVAKASGRAIDFVRSNSDFGDAYPEARFRDDLNRMMQGTAPAERSPTFVELVSGGQMHLIRDETLRGALVAYDAHLLRTNEVYRIFVDMQMRYGEMVIPAIVFDDRIADNGLASELSVGSFDLDTMRTHSGVLPAMSMIRRAHLYNMEWQSTVVELAANVRKLLDEAR